MDEKQMSREVASRGGNMASDAAQRTRDIFDLLMSKGYAVPDRYGFLTDLGAVLMWLNDSHDQHAALRRLKLVMNKPLGLRQQAAAEGR